ncbi:MAG TPA: tRNA-dihydrouridine synthase, partial [Candidatus Saccharibacteria bacterium]|nr:tRNA-dihydrouridine synthase [Candidatus Saccharibacteria bacterium]
IGSLLKAEPATIAIHLRTRKEMSKVPAHWEALPEIVKFINENTTPQTRPLIIGNGDILI